jgi:small subunit ribosomal protein S6
MYLLDANRYSRDPGNVSGRVQEMIEKAGGEILASRLWAEQKLAYPINGQRKGAYWLTYFRLDGDKLTELRRASQLNNDVLRDLILAVDDRLVDALVAHAKSSGKPAPAEKPADKPAATTEAKAEGGDVAVKDAPPAES